jgi:hypothetical protein
MENIVLIYVHYIGGYIGPTASQEGKAKRSPLGLPGVQSQSFSPQPNYYTDWATLTTVIDWLV